MYDVRMTMFERLHENALADNDLLRQNDRAGDVFPTARDVDFGFKTEERFRADDLAKFVNDKNFGKASVLEQDAGNCFVSVVIHTPITQAVICSLSGFMLCLSRLFGVEYDGWGSVIQTQDADTIAAKH